MYRNLGCRCEPCKAAGAEYRKRERARNYQRIRERERAYKERSRKDLAAAGRRYYKEHTAEVLARQSQRYAEFKEQLAIVKAFVGCRECGSHPASIEEARLFDWHHRDASTKRYKVSLMHCLSLQSVNAEIAKCDVLCQGCHRAAHTRSTTVQKTPPS